MNKKTEIRQQKCTTANGRFHAMAAVGVAGNDLGTSIGEATYLVNKIIESLKIDD